METHFFDGDGPVELPVAAIFAAVTSIVETGKTDEFIKACDDQGFSVVANVELINFAKTFLAENEQFSPEFAESPVAQRSRNVRRCQHPWQCKEQ